MIEKRLVGYIIALLLVLSSCKHSVRPEKLYGEWKYVKVESLKDPAENVSSRELTEQDPSIRFYKNGGLLIIWGGKKLTSGKFHLEGDIIRYVETLRGGTKRPIPFLIRQLTDEKLVFETMEQDATRITARKN